MFNIIIGIGLCFASILYSFRFYLEYVSKRVYHVFDKYPYKLKKDIIQFNYKELLKKYGKIKLEKHGDVHVYRNRNNIRDKLDLTFLKKVISIDVENKIVHVEGLIRFDDLVKYTLKYGFLPQVVPELKSLTVGGVISGLGLESSSFKYGLFHHSAVEYEILTGNGDIIVANKENNKELFDSFPNTYGSIGYIISAKIKLLSAKKYVKTENIVFDNVENYLNEIDTIMTDETLKKNIDFLDGIILNKNTFVLIKGVMVPEAMGDVNNYIDNIYFRSVDKLKVNYMTIGDYIWRYDANYFFLSKQIPILENSLVRKFFRNVLSSDKLFKISNNPIINILKKLCTREVEYIGNDIATNKDNFIDFFKFFTDLFGVYPIWVCPYNTTKNDVFFKSDHNYEIDFGIGFGVSIKNIDGRNKNFYKKTLDKHLYEMSMKKGLYPTTFLTEKQFYDLYDPENKYPSLKEKYDKHDKFYTLSEKVLCNK